MVYSTGFPIQRSRFLNKLIASGILLFIFAVAYVVVIAKSQLLVLGAIILAGVVAFAYNQSPDLKRRVSEIVDGEHRIMGILGCILAVLAPLPLRRDPYTLHVLVTAGIYVILALGLNFQVGSTGIPNLGFAAFYGVGAYASSLLAISLHLSFWVSMFLGAFLAALSGFLVGLPSLKTRTYHLALVSIAFGLVTYILLNNLAFTGGPNGVKDIPPPVLFGHSLFSSMRLFDLPYPMQLNFYYLVLFFLLLTIVAAYFLYHSKIGLFWNAVREDEIAAKCSGINVSRAKLLAFSVGAFFAGLAGALYAHYIGYISPENFNMNVSLLILAMVIMGGMDSISGTSAGAFFLTIAPEKFRFLSDYRMVATGLIIIFMLIFRSSGIIPQRIREYSTIFAKRRAMREQARHE